MKTESTIKPKNRFLIEKKGNTCEIVFFDDIKKEERTREDGEEVSKETIYVYNTYKIDTVYRDKLEEEIESNISTWLNFAKEKNIEAKALEVRAERDRLLSESDKDMLIDRLGLDIPTSINSTNMLSAIKAFFESFISITTGDIAKYRQELRDITKQDGFPFNVKFPDKPNK